MSAKCKKSTYYVHNMNFVVFHYCEDNKDCITHILLRDNNTGIYDNLDNLQGDNHTVVIDKVDDKEINYETINLSDIEKIKYLVVLLIERGIVSEDVKIFLDNIGGYRLWNLDILEGYKVY